LGGFQTLFLLVVDWDLEENASRRSFFLPPQSSFKELSFEEIPTNSPLPVFSAVLCDWDEQTSFPKPSRSIGYCNLLILHPQPPLIPLTFPDTQRRAPPTPPIGTFNPTQAITTRAFPLPACSFNQSPPDHFITPLTPSLSSL